MKMLVLLLTCFLLWNFLQVPACLPDSTVGFPEEETIDSTEVEQTGEEDTTGEDEIPEEEKITPEEEVEEDFIPPVIETEEEASYLPPPLIQYGRSISVRPVAASPCDAYMQILAAACDYRNVRRDAVSLIRPGNTGDLNFGMLCDLYDYCNLNWGYVPDPMGDDTPYSASESLELMRGDCDDFAVLVYSMMTAVGFDARIYCGKNKKGGHCFAEVNLGQGNIKPIRQYLESRYDLQKQERLTGHTDSTGDQWLSLDWASYPGGHCDSYDTYVITYPQRGYCTGN